MSAWEASTPARTRGPWLVAAGFQTQLLGRIAFWRSKNDALSPTTNSSPYSCTPVSITQVVTEALALLRWADQAPAADTSCRLRI